MKKYKKRLHFLAEAVAGDTEACVVVTITVVFESNNEPSGRTIKQFIKKHESAGLKHISQAQAWGIEQGAILAGNFDPDGGGV